MERVIIDKSDTVLEIEVKTNVSKAIKDMDKLFRSLKKLEKIDVSNIEVLNKINSSNLIKIEQEIKSLNSEINRLQKTGTINFTSVANGLDLKNSLGIDTNILDKQADSCIVLSDYISSVSLDFEKLIQDMASVDSLGELDKMFGNMLSNAFGPFRVILDDTLQHVIGFTQKVTEALGAIFGWKFEVGSTAGTFDDWSSNAQNVAASTGVAAKNVEKMSKGVRAFDELNVIKTQDTSYSSGGVGNSGASIGGEFVKTKTIWDNYKSDIDTLSKLGSYIGETLTKALNQINWSRIYEGARNFGKGLADFLNALISPDLFGAVGQTIAKALNTAIYAALSFGQNFNFENFGYSIASAINNFFENFDFKVLAQTLNTWVNGVKQIIVTAITNIHWGDVFKGIGTFFSNLDVNATFLLMIPAIKKLYPLLDNIVLTFTALSGNTAALSKLTASFPKLGKVVKIASDSFSYLKTGIQNGQFFAGLNLGIENIRNNLTGLQKGIIGVVAVVGEFKVMKNAFSDIVRDSNNVGASLGKIAAAASLASLALYTAFGPAGLAVAAITGVVALIVGIKEAFNEIRVEEIGNSIKKAFSNPGGISLEEITNQYTNTIQKIGEGFCNITEKSSELQQADLNIRDTWLEIEKIETSMNMGVLSVEEGTSKLTELFEKLSMTAKEKFTSLEDTLIIAFGENGILSKVYDKLGISVENTVTTILQINDKVENRIKELTELLSTTDPSNPNYWEYKEELANLMTQADKLTESINNYELALSQIDYSNLIIEDGSLDKEKLEKFLNEVAITTQEANENVTNAIEGIKASLTEELKYAIDYYGENSPQAEEIQEKLNALPRALELLKRDISLKAVELTDVIQLDFINSINGIIQNAKSEWGEKGFWGQAWNRITGGAASETGYVKEAVDKQKKNIEELSLAIKSSFDNLKIDNVAWGSEALEEIYKALFDFQSEYIGNRDLQGVLNDNYKEIIDGATEGIAQLAKERAAEFGSNTIIGYDESIENNSDSSKEVVETWMTKVVQAIHNSAMRFGSPSKTTEQFGMDTIEGYNIGIIKNEDKTINEISIYINKILDKFSDIKLPFMQIGIDAMNGLYDGFASMESTLYKKLEEIAYNLTNTIKTTLQIHSPSKVMFELGDYTMQGFQNGLENVYLPILVSMKKFSYILQAVPMSSMNNIYKKSPYVAITNDCLSSYDRCKQDYFETNILLRQLLTVVQEGKIIEINGKEIGRTSLHYIQGEERRLKKALVGQYNN